jgi:mannose-6-phosphate isomerase-like protein (cupin superfamily)
VSIHASADSVQEQTADMGSTSFTTKVVYGNSASLMVATRPADYHSAPHYHDCEQLNWLQNGELWVFVDEAAYHLRAGDFIRIPAGQVHWSWNKGDAPCTLIEVHSPGLHADPLVKKFAVSLHRDGEVPDFLGSPVNTFLPENDSFDPSVAEQKAE